MQCLLTHIWTNDGRHRELAHMPWYDAGEALNYAHALRPTGPDGRLRFSIELTVCDQVATPGSCPIQPGLVTGVFETHPRIEGPYAKAE